MLERIAIGVAKPPQTEAGKWNQQTSELEGFELTPDMGRDFQRLLAALGLTMHFTGAHIPQRMEDFAVNKIEEWRQAIASAEKELESRRQKKDQGIDDMEARLKFNKKQLELMEKFLARHGGDASRERLGLAA